MEQQDPTYPSIRRVLLGAILGLAFGLFVNVPWGPLARPDAPGLQLVLPASLGFTILGAWLAFMTGLG